MVTAFAICASLPFSKSCVVSCCKSEGTGDRRLLDHQPRSPFCLTAYFWRVDWRNQSSKRVAPIKTSHPIHQDQDGWAPLCQLEISFSQGAEWKALISRLRQGRPQCRFRHRRPQLHAGSQSSWRNRDCPRTSSSCRSSGETSECQPLSYSSRRRHQTRVSLRPLGARSSHWYMPQRPSSPRA